MPIDYTKRPAAPAATPAAPATPPSAPSPSVPSPSVPSPSAPGEPQVSLSKVTLTKAAPTVSLSKHGGVAGRMRINLNWDAKPGGGGFFRRSAPLDLDLGCLYEFADGSKGVVQALGNSFTATDKSGHLLIRLDGDDRSGSVSTGENLFIDLDNSAAIRRVLIFALIYEGAANWADANGVVTLFPNNAPPVEVRLDDPRNGARICAIALLENRGGEVVVQREVQYLDGAQRALDAAYGWGMQWRSGHK